MNLSHSNAKVYSGAAIALLALAVIVSRFYNFAEIPFTYDEYSTLNRAKHENLSNLIEYGVKQDTQPAGLEVFTFVWSKIFGESERATKLPYIIMSLLALLYLFKLAKYCFNETVALTTTALVGLLQFVVMQSQIARPYPSGMFFCIALVYVFIRFSQEDKRLWLRVVVMALLFALCAYNHYFSLLQAGLLWIVGIFMLNKKKRTLFFIATLISILLYLPHINVFLAQIKMGGIATLKNEFSFWYKFLQFLFQYSWVIVSSLLLICFVALYHGRWKIQPQKIRGTRILFFILGIAPFLIAWTYSELYVPLITERVLYFSFPFLLLALLSFMPAMKPAFNLGMIAFLIVVLSYSLIFERQHYSLFYTSSFEKVLIRGNETCNHNGLSFISAIDHVENRVYEKFGIAQPCRFLISDSTKISDIRNELEAKNYEQIFFGWTTQFFIPPTEIAAVIAEHYPVVVERGEYVDGEYMIFSKSNTASNNKAEEFVPILNWSDKPSQWQVAPELIYQDSLGHNEVRFDNHHDFGMGINLPIEQILPTSSNWLKASALLEGLDSLSKVVMVVTIERDGETIHWSGKNASDFVEFGKNATWIHNILRPEMSLMNKDLSNSKLSVYLWNPALENFTVKQFTISEISGNSNLYYFNKKH